ncbi:competence type IV pilus minor pilin ComGG [Pseudoneobacillus sp. C159]
MIKNEKGFTYPIVMLLVLLFSFYFTYHIQFYLGEKAVFQESKKVLKQEYYFHSTVKKLERYLQNTPNFTSSGLYVYNSGQANYLIESYSNQYLKVTISLKLTTMNEVEGTAFYDKTQYKMTKWLERN